MAEVDASLRSAAYELGFVPTAYSEMTDFQILKAEGVYMVEKIRTIKLMAAQFNENNKKLGHLLDRPSPTLGRRVGPAGGRFSSGGQVRRGVVARRADIPCHAD